MKQAIRLLGQTFSRWNGHEGQRLGAALAFYTLLSGAPFALFVLLVLSKFMNQQAVENKMMSAARQILGANGARAVRTVITATHKTHHGTLAAVIALATLLFGASGVFMELRDDLNRMWDGRTRETGILGMILQRVFSFVLVLAAGGMVLASMLAGAAVAVIANSFRRAIPVPAWTLEVANFVVSFVLLTILFLLIYRFVPDLTLPWRTLWTGAAVSALLFVIGKGLLALYFTEAGVGSAYGAAGSIIAIALWVYYSAQIFLLGAEFTYLWGRRHPPVPAEARRAA